MKNLPFEVTEDALIVMGVAIGLDQIESVLGIVILSIQIALILFKGGKLVYNKIKNKDYTGAIETVKDTVDKVEDNVKKIEEIKNNGGHKRS